MTTQPDRSPAQFFFEVGYGACWAEAFVRNDSTPPFPLTDAIVERAWAVAGEAHDDPEEFDHHHRLAASAPALLEALETLFPSNLGVVPAHLPDSFVFPVDVTAGEFRKAFAAIASARGAA